MKKYFLILSVIPVLLSGCGGANKESLSNIVSTPPSYSFINPNNFVKEFGDFHTKEQGAYLKSDYDSIFEYADGTKNLSSPDPISIDCENYSYLEISSNSDFTDSLIKQVENTFDFYNAYLDTTYYYRLANDELTLSTSEVKSFKTCDYGIRNIYVDGVTNVRDVGGHIAENGKKSKQGLLYRGARFNATAASEFTLEITEKGIDTVKNDLKIKTEIDLRKEYDNEIGSISNSTIDDVAWVNIPIKNETGNYLTGNKEDFGKVFKLLSDKNNYPVYFHCDIGTDRTGLVSYIVNGLIGVSNIELYQDFLFSNFGNIRAKRKIDSITTYKSNLKDYGFDSLSKNIEAYLLDCGLTQNEVDNIKNIMLGD